MTRQAGYMQAMRRIRRVHFVGIGGSGMSGIAEVLMNQGFEVSGSDTVESEVTRRLVGIGASIQVGHSAANVEGADVLVVSSAIREDNSEVGAAREQRIPVVPRAEMLAELMRFRRGIAIAGTHGKTTTTSLTASLLAAAGLDPTSVVGGILNAWGSNVRLGEGEYLVAEADESDGSFLLLQPVIALVTNIDRDHLENYDHSFDGLRKAFLEFLHHLPFYGVAVLCVDDENIRDLVPRVSRAVVTYGLHEAADVRATNVRQDGRRMHFDVHLPGEHKVVEVSLNLPGKHNVQNALGAIAIAWELGLDIEKLVPDLKEFQGVGRRFAPVGRFEVSGGVVEIVEDYGHHPTELEATMQAARDGWPGKRLVIVFQPHRFSRTRDLLDEFSQVLGAADAVVLTDIYPAGEEPIDGVDSGVLCQSIRARGRVHPVLVSNVHDLPAELPAMLEDGDLVLMLGAGTIGHVATEFRKDGFGLGAVQ